MARYFAQEYTHEIFTNRWGTRIFPPFFERMDPSWCPYVDIVDALGKFINSLTEVVLHFINIMVRGIIIIRRGCVSLGGNLARPIKEENKREKNNLKIFWSFGIDCLCWSKRFVAPEIYILYV